MQLEKSYLVALPPEPNYFMKYFHPDEALFLSRGSKLPFDEGTTQMYFSEDEAEKAIEEYLRKQCDNPLIQDHECDWLYAIVEVNPNAETIESITKWEYVEAAFCKDEVVFSVPSLERTE